MVVTIDTGFYLHITISLIIGRSLEAQDWPVNRIQENGYFLPILAIHCAPFKGSTFGKKH